MGDERQAHGLYCGVDIGASATKLLLLDDEDHVRARVVRPSGVSYEETAAACLALAREEAGGVGPPRRTVATGYGRRSVLFADEARTEIHCHGLGCHHLLPRALCIVDIGCQDNKIIHLDEDGRRREFKMNRKCAAGTGAFIEEIALRLDLPLGDMDSLAADSSEAESLSSFCTVFAKTEILAKLRAGVAVPAIVRGAFASVIDRIMEMDPLDGAVVLTGGVVAYNPTLARMLGERLGREVTVPPHPQFTGALGAALQARRQVHDD